MNAPRSTKTTTTKEKISLATTIEEKIRRPDRIIKICAIISVILIFFGYLLVTTAIFINAERTREAAILLHYRTQHYVRCIAEVLVLPLAERDEGVIDNCTKQADAITKLPK